MAVLFPIQKKTKKVQLYVLLACMLFAIFYCIIKFTVTNSFLSYHKQSYYIPLNGDSSGFTGKVNAILAAALLDTNENVQFDVRNG